MPDENGHETAEEAAERVAQVRSSQIFGDTPTDPTIGDAVVPVHDEEAGNAAAAEVFSRQEDGDDDANDISNEEAKRQLEDTPSEEDFANADENRADDDGFSLGSDEDPDGDGPELSAKDKIAKIEAANSVEEVDALVAGDERKTVKDAADKKRSSL